MAITSISVVVALFIGGLEVLQVVGSELHASGGFWDTVQVLSFANLGFYIIALFLASWLISVAVYKAKRIDELDVMRAVPVQPNEWPGK
jgi:nickel/cobalt transporter (NiCoT) family protein